MMSFGSFTYVRDSNTYVRDSFTYVRDSFTYVRDSNTYVNCKSVVNTYIILQEGRSISYMPDTYEQVIYQLPV